MSSAASPPPGSPVCGSTVPGAPAPGSPPAPQVPDEVLLARAYLLRVAEPPAPALARFVEEHGPVAAAARVRRGEVPEPVDGETAARRAADRAAADIAAAAACGAWLLTPEHDEWPQWPFSAFAVSADPQLAAPLALWVRGPSRLAELCERAVAIVGSRACTSYGRHVAQELAVAVAERGYTVVSGAAIGIDGAAHRGALSIEGPTVAVMACGVERAYPAAHETLLARVAAGGLVVSEYPPGAVPAKHRFLVRNRLIAAMAAGVVVVEAGMRSGAARTAADAARLGRHVMAVPGPVTCGVSAGCHRMIREGAELVTRPEEVLESVGRIGLDLAEPPTGPGRPTDGLDRAAVLVHDALPARAPRECGWLAMEAGVPQDAVRVALVELERRGLAEHREGRWRRRPQCAP